MIEFDCEEVKRQLNKLATAFPADNVDIWLKAVNGLDGRRLEYTLFIHPRPPLDTECECGDNLTVMMDAMLSRREKRNADWIAGKRKAIEKARLELAKLESELDPIVMAVDKAQCESQPVNSTQESK